MTSPASSDGAAATLSILIVDDNADAADSLGMLIEFEGHEVTVVLGGAQALEVGARLQPSIAFIDIGMPVMDGYELARQIRQQPWGQSMLLVASTGWGGEDDKLRALEAGFNRHITKPAEIDTLLAAIAEWQASRPA
jgi:CheY-like chemotaxis protein